MKKIVAILFALLMTSISFGQFAESFDSAASDVLFNEGTDTAFTFLDYSTLGIPEAPRPVAGGAATSGLKLEANLTGTSGGINVLAGVTPQSFSGDYRVSYDAYLSFGGTTGSTEQLIWLVGNDNGVVASRVERNNGVVGTFGWLAGENGYGTADAASHEGANQLGILGDTQLGQDVPFNNAFRTDANGECADDLSAAPNGAAAFEWVQVDIDVSDNGDGTSSVKTYFNFEEFFDVDVPTAAATGFAGFGYEDPFGSVNDAPADTFGLFDNLTVSTGHTGAPMGTVPDPLGCAVPEPSSALTIMLGLFGLLGLRRR